METKEPQGMRSLESIANDPTRTHRDWYPKYGRVQKCDYCNARSAGTLHVCSSCSVRICEDCARNREWDSDRSRHFIDVDACDWLVKKPVRLPNNKTNGTRGTKRPAQTGPGDDELSTPAARRRRLEAHEDEDDDSVTQADATSDTRPPPGPRFDPTHARHDGYDNHEGRSIYQHPNPHYHGHNQPSLPEQQAAGPSRLVQYGGMRPEEAHDRRTPPGAVPAPRTRPEIRQTAARAMLSMSQYSRPSPDGCYKDNTEEYGDDEYHDDPDDSNDHDEYEEKGYAENANGPRHRSNRPAENPSVQPPTRGRDHSAQLGAPRAPPLGEWRIPTAEDRDRQVLDVYHWMYGNRPNLSPNRIRTRIPDRWVGDWQSPTSQYPAPSRQTHDNERHHSSDGYSRPPPHPTYLLPPHNYHRHNEVSPSSSTPQRLNNIYTNPATPTNPSSLFPPN